MQIERVIDTIQAYQSTKVNDSIQQTDRGKIRNCFSLIARLLNLLQPLSICVSWIATFCRRIQYAHSTRLLF
jgi:hypothetical protein